APTRQEPGALTSAVGSRGDVEQILGIEAGGCARPASPETVASKAHLVRMRGNDVFKTAVREMTHAAQEVLDKAGLTLDDVRMVVPHQANLRIINAMSEALQ